MIHITWYISFLRRVGGSGLGTGVILQYYAWGVEFKGGACGDCSLVVNLLHGKKKCVFYAESCK